MKCWKCGAEQEETRVLPFRATCDNCHAWLHCCVNCVNYHPGLPNDCKIPGTESIADREGCNFCEEFSLLGTGPKKPSDDAKKNFDALFGDD